MRTTKLSTKGQVVIPESIRTGLEEGTVFVVSRQADLIVLKRVTGLTEKEKREMNELDKIWAEIDSGKCDSYGVEEFFEKMKKW